jgi:hypothetical protein
LHICIDFWKLNATTKKDPTNYLSWMKFWTR